MISSLLHLVGLRPRVYYTLTNFRGGGKAPLAPPQYANDIIKIFIYIFLRENRKRKLCSKTHQIAQLTRNLGSMLQYP